MKKVSMFIATIALFSSVGCFTGRIEMKPQMESAIKEETDLLPAVSTRVDPETIDESNYLDNFKQLKSEVNREGGTAKRK